MNKKLSSKSASKFSAIFAPFIVFVILLITLGFSAFQNTGIIADISSTVRPQLNIRVTGLEVDSTSNATVISKDYSSTGISNVYTGKVFSSVTFTSTSSSVTYKVEVTNFGNTEMGIASITGLPSNLTYELNTNNYNIGEKICNSSNQCTLGAKKDIYNNKI